MSSKNFRRVMISSRLELSRQRPGRDYHDRSKARKTRRRPPTPARSSTARRSGAKVGLPQTNTSVTAPPSGLFRVADLLAVLPRLALFLLYALSALAVPWF